MFETVTSTTSSVLTFGNFTLASANPTAIIQDANATEFWNATERINENVYSPCDPDPQNTEFNCSVDDYLSYYLGAKQMPLETAIWVSSLSLLSRWKLFNELIIATNSNGHARQLVIISVLLWFYYLYPISIFHSKAFHSHKSTN